MSGVSMADYFFMREGFDKFQLDPELNRQILIGTRDREKRDRILEALEDAAAGAEGHKSVVYGDFGRGKTHEALNIIWEIERRQLSIVPVYFKCHEFNAKEPFSTVFGKLLLRLTAPRVKEAAEEYARRAAAEIAPPMMTIVGAEDIDRAFGALAHPNPDIVGLALRWLGGERKLPTNQIAPGLRPHLAVSTDYASVMKGLAQLFKIVESKILVFFIDEAERFSQVTHTDTYWSWVASLRALTELFGVGYIFYLGAKTRDEIPDMFRWDEIVRRIGPTNYIDLVNPGPDELREWIIELLSTLIRKGEIPEPHRLALASLGADARVPPDLEQLIKGDPEALATYPFTPAAMKTFVAQCADDNLANKPSEVLKRIHAGAKRAMRKKQPMIDPQIVTELQSEGF